jgi:hypothetical protein
MAWHSRHQASSGECHAASTLRRLCAPALEGLESEASSACVPPSAPSATGGGPDGAWELCQSNRQAFAPFPCSARTLSALLGRTTGSQCALPSGWPADDQAVRRDIRLCYLARRGSGLNFAIGCLGIPSPRTSRLLRVEPHSLFSWLFLASSHLLPFSLSIPLFLPPVLAPWHIRSEKTTSFSNGCAKEPAQGKGGKQGRPGVGLPKLYACPPGSSGLVSHRP